MKKENISLPKAFNKKEEDNEECVEEEENSEDEGLNVKGLIAIIIDSPNGMCKSDDSHTVKGSSLNLGKTFYLDNGSSRHMTGFKSPLTNFAEKDGPMCWVLRFL